MGQKRGGGMEGRERRRVVGAGVAAPGAYWRRRRACRGPRSLRLWLGGGGRKARLGEVAIAEPWVGVDSSKPPRLLVTVASLWVGGPSRRRLAEAGRRKPKPPRAQEWRLALPKLRRSVGWAGRQMGGGIMVSVWVKSSNLRQKWGKISSLELF